MTDPGFIKIIHPETGGIAEVAEAGQATWWRSGWVPLTEDNAPPAAELDETAPGAMTADEVAAAQGAKTSRRSSKTKTDEE